MIEHIGTESFHCLRIAFECVSAISTVGSSLNLPPHLLGDDSKLLVALLMFVGRVGLITLMLGIIKQKEAYEISVSERTDYY